MKKDTADEKETYIPQPSLGFIEAINSCFSKFITISGRARRSEYWWFSLFFFILTTPCFLIPFIGWIVWLIMLIPYITVWIRRLHDANHSGWHVITITLTSFIGIGIVWWIIWALQESDQTSNKYDIK